MATIIIIPDRPFMLGLQDGLAGRNAPNNRGFGMSDLRMYAEGQRVAKERMTVKLFDNTVVFDGASILGSPAGIGPDTPCSFGCGDGGSDGGGGGD